MQRRNIAALFVGTLSGLMLILTGYHGISTGFWGLAIQIAILLSPSPLITNILVIALSILTFLAFLGGWTILIGCLLLLIGRHRSGFYFIGIGAGLSLMGLIWNLAQMWLTSVGDPVNFWITFLDFFISKYQGVAWLGAIFAVISQELIRIGKEEPEEVLEEQVDEIQQEKTNE